MSTVTQPLRDEHRELWPHIESLREAADHLDTASPETTRSEIADAYDFLAHHLLPHAQAEEQALYPVVGRLLGASEATATMSREHVEIGRLTEELGTLRARLDQGALSQADRRDLRRVLYGLHALVKSHFANEEEVYLPLLDARLSATDAQAMFVTMEDAAHAAKSRVASN